MELSDEIFSEIAGVAVIDPVYELKHERRAHLRVAFGGRARIAPLFDTLSHRGVTVMVRDISRVGIGFLSPQRLEGGDEFVICLRSKSDKLIKIHCLACRCDPGGVGLTQFDIGATFELVLETNAVPEETAGPAEVSASPAPPPAFSTGDLGHNGGPISRFLIRPVTRSAGGIWSFICTCRNNYRVRRRLKADARNRKLHEETKPTGNASPAPDLLNQSDIGSLFTPPENRTFVPRPGGLFKVDSSSNPPSPAAPEPTVVESVPTPVVQEVAQEVVEQTAMTPAEAPAICAADQTQLEFSWQPGPASETTPAAPMAAPVVEIPATPATPVAETVPLQAQETAEAAAAEIAPVVESTSAEAPIHTEVKSDQAPGAESSPMYRTHADVVALLKKRQASWVRHPRRYRQT